MKITKRGKGKLPYSYIEMDDNETLYISAKDKRGNRLKIVVSSILNNVTVYHCGELIHFDDTKLINNDEEMRKMRFWR